jgi:SAM-dependent methyltransferase
MLWGVNRAKIRLEAEFAGRYSSLEDWHWWFRGRREVLAELLARGLDHGPVRQGSRRIVSVGSGPPQSVTWLLRFVGSRGTVTGLDSDPSGALRTLMESGRLGHDIPGLQFVLGAIESLPFKRMSCDVVAALDVLEHLDDDVTALRNAAELVAPGGLLLVTVPACPALWGNQDEISHHRRRYTAKSLKAAFRAAGLEPTFVSYFNTILFPAIAAIRLWRRLLGSVENRSDFELAQPGGFNDLLAGLFGFEARLLKWAALPFGVSLVAVWGQRRL